LNMCTPRRNSGAGLLVLAGPGAKSCAVFREDANPRGARKIKFMTGTAIQFASNAPPPQPRWLGGGER